MKKKIPAVKSCWQLSTVVKKPKTIISHFLSLNVRYKPNTQDLQNIKLAKFQNRRLCINAYACLT